MPIWLDLASFGSPHQARRPIPKCSYQGYKCSSSYDGLLLCAISWLHVALPTSAMQCSARGAVGVARGGTDLGRGREIERGRG